MPNGTVVTIGTFDGVHRGHQAILAAVRAEAHARGLRAIALAFQAPPRKDAARRLLLPPEVKAALLRRAVDEVVPVAFAEVRHLPPERFVDDVLVGALHAQVVVIGSGFRFGAARAGTAEDLCSLAGAAGVDVRVVPPVTLDGAAVSSTRIRQLLSSGDVETARRLLGRPPLLVGPVIAGDRIGRRIGYPTANLALSASILRPADGIYIADAYLADKPHPSLLYTGRRPTLGSPAERCEVHLLDEPGGTLRGRTLEVHLLRRLREDRAFPDVEALQRQIGEDVRAARALRPTLPPPSPPVAG